MDKYIILYLLTGTRGGENRLRILKELEKEPINANKLKEKLKIDYKTVQHHLRVLVKHRFVKNSDQKYGDLFYLTDELLRNKEIIEEIWEKVNKDRGDRK
jgi:DNA-binding transcriptional ArsR family regulator